MVVIRFTFKCCDYNNSMPADVSGVDSPIHFHFNEFGVCLIRIEELVAHFGITVSVKVKEKWM